MRKQAPSQSDSKPGTGDRLRGLAPVVVKGLLSIQRSKGADLAAPNFAKKAGSSQILSQ
jgi:hypothetical protein